MTGPNSIAEGPKLAVEVVKGNPAERVLVIAPSYEEFGGFAVQVIQDEPGLNRRILRMTEDSASYRWETVPEGTAIAPTMLLPDEIGRLLLDALTRHYQGATDMHTVRSDLLHERGRVDKALDALIRIATEVPGDPHADFFMETEQRAAAVGRGITGLFEHHHAAEAAPRTPAARPAAMAAANAAAAPKETPMSLTTLSDDVKADLTDGLNWLDGFVSRVKAAAPGIIATTEAVGGSTVSALVEAVAGRILPPQAEQMLAALVSDFVSRYAQPAQTAAPVQQPVPAQ